MSRQRRSPMIAIPTISGRLRRRITVVSTTASNVLSPPWHHCHHCHHCHQFRLRFRLHRHRPRPRRLILIVQSVLPLRGRRPRRHGAVLITMLGALRPRQRCRRRRLANMIATPASPTGSGDGLLARRHSAATPRERHALRRRPPRPRRRPHRQPRAPTTAMRASATGRPDGLSAKRIIAARPWAAVARRRRPLRPL